MKRTVVMLLTALMLMSLTACSGGTDSAAEETPDTENVSENVKEESTPSGSGAEAEPDVNTSETDPESAETAEDDGNMAEATDQETSESTEPSGNSTAIVGEDARPLTVEAADCRVDLISNVIYRQIWKGTTCTQLKMNLILPQLEEKKPAPVLVFIKGSGFTDMNLDGWMQQRMYIAQAGYAVVEIEGRMVPDATFPASIIDFKAGIRYLRAHAEEYNLDTDRIAVMGESSGAYAACMLGTTNGVEEFEEGDYLEESSDVACVIDFYGPTDLTTIGKGLGAEIEAGHLSSSTTEAMLVNGTAFGDNPGGGIMEFPEKAEKANPITYIDENDPPFLIMHGDADLLVSPYESKILYEALKENHIEAEYYSVLGAGHGTIEFFQKDLLDIVVEFLDRHIKK